MSETDFQREERPESMHITAQPSTQNTLTSLYPHVSNPKESLRCVALSRHSLDQTWIYLHVVPAGREGSPFACIDGLSVCRTQISKLAQKAMCHFKTLTTHTTTRNLHNKMKLRQKESTQRHGMHLLPIVETDLWRSMRTF